MLENVCVKLSNKTSSVNCTNSCMSLYSSEWTCLLPAPLCADMCFTLWSWEFGHNPILCLYWILEQLLSVSCHKATYCLDKAYLLVMEAPHKHITKQKSHMAFSHWVLWERHRRNTLFWKVTVFAWNIRPQSLDHKTRKSNSWLSRAQPFSVPMLVWNQWALQLLALAYRATGPGAEVPLWSVANVHWIRCSGWPGVHFPSLPTIFVCLRSSFCFW